MTKTLTEQWRDGTLPAGHYYCKLYYNGFKPRIQECVKSAYSPKSCIPMSCGCEGEEVLAPVPSYDEWKQMIDGDKARYRMDKDCHNLQQFLDRMNHFHDLEKENKRLKNHLHIAKKALNDILNDGDDYWDKDKAQEALTKMECVK